MLAYRSTPTARTVPYAPRRNLKAEMIAWAKEEGIFAKGLGLLDDGNYSILG